MAHHSRANAPQRRKDVHTGQHFHHNQSFTANQNRMMSPQMSADRGLPPMDRAVNSVVTNTRRAVNNVMERTCGCDREFVCFTRMHCISHDECHQMKLRCDLCAVKADAKSIQHHISSQKHCESHEKLMHHLFLRSIPKAIQSHTNRLSEVLANNYTINAVTDHHVRRRHEVVERLNHLLKANRQHCSARLYGSSINGFALKLSNINIELIFPNSPPNSETQQTQQTDTSFTMLSKVSDLIAREKSQFSHIRNEYNLKIPKMFFVDNQTKLMCELSITAEKSYRTSKLLHKYSILDKRVRILGVALREWARICYFDDQENGTWPSIAFPILVIHYLQRCVPPVLPCLHEMIPHNVSCEPQANKSASKLNENDVNEDDLLDFSLSDINWRTANTMSEGELWLDMLKYYSAYLDLETFVVSIRHTKNLETHKEKRWSSRVLAIEDPFRPTLNLSRSVGCMKIYNIFLDLLSNTYKYFAIPFVTSLPVYPNSRGKPLYVERNFDIIVDETNACNNDNFEDDLIAKINNSVDLNHDRHTNAKKDSDDSEQSEDDNNQKKESDFNKIRRMLRLYGIRMVLNREAEYKINSIQKEQLIYTFQLRSMPFFQKTPKFCRICRRYGHQQNRCPDERLPDLFTLPPIMNELHKIVLDDICHHLFSTQRMTEHEENLYSLVMDDLEVFIQRKMPVAKLELFGSTKNGFGTRNSDLDICLTFENNETGEGLNYGDIIETVGQILRLHANIKEITPITSAKVPIVKFKYVINDQRRDTIECDISLYNILARYNTRLVKAYCNIDSRVQILGFVVKNFAKVCDICDASRGSLSSYAYTLMTLHFLQQRGIIPCLQEIGLHRKTDRIIDTWNTWFYDDLSDLTNIWKSTPNNQTVAELFLDFLVYYSEIFNFDENVVCCRQLAPLKRLDKMWTGRKIAIEDPFELSHNLGAGVDNQMATFIRTAFIKGRNIIGCPPPSLPTKYSNWLEYFFDNQLLTHGRPPTGRGCRHCGKIGHKQSECNEKPGGRQQRQLKARNP